MLDRQSDSLHSAFNFLPQNPTATHPPLHPVQPPASTSSAALFSSSGIPVQSNMELAELNTTSVVIDQQQPAPLSRLFLDDPPNKDGKNSIGVHRFRNTFLDHRPEDIPSQHPLAPLRSLSTTGRPSMSTVRSPGHSTEPKQEIPPPSTKIRDPYSGKRHGSPSSASSLDSDVGSTPTSGSTLLSSVTFAGKAAANVSSPAPRVVPGQIRIKQRGDGMSPKKPTVADAATASSRGNTASRSHAHAATSVSNRRQTSVYREKYPKAITTSVEATPPVAAGAKTSTPRRNGRAADKTSPRVSGGGGSETTNVPVDATNVPTTPRSIKSKSSTPSGESSHVVPSPQRGNLNRQGSPTVTEPVPSSADGAAGDITVVEDSTDEGLVSQDTDHDNATAATDVVETPPYDKPRENERRIGDGGASDASVDDDVPAPCPLIELSSPPSPKPSTDQAVATKEELQASPAFDVPELKNVALVTEPASQHDHDDVSVAAPLHQPVHHEVQPPSSEDDMPTRPATAPVLSKKRSDKRNRRTAAASDNVPAAISTNAPKAHGPMDKKKSDSGMKLSHRRQDHGKDETSCADGSAAPPHRSPYPNEDDDDDLFAPVPRSAWSVIQSAFVASCVWLVSASGASTGLPWLLTCVQWVLSTLMTLIFHVGFHALTYGIKFHRFVVRGLVLNRNIASCFAFLYLFPLLVQYVIPWAPPWAPVCLWYAFLVQLFCTQGSTTMVATFRILLPLVFLVEGVSHHSFLLDLNGAELLLISFILSAVKTGNLYSPVFFMSLSLQCLSAVFLGSEMFVQWLQLAIALYSLHSMATDEWVRFPTC
ncbi:hypothetical protein DYB32_006033 [Aphanomyces invadans]|uniref:Transmembrane protein n=1 Tax=Aphanomyces invadans TaxID=157072 RepID=A0A3R6WK08_9STRA|nr:hypothetical protein DYB32_006033 [Aphanomyces invadans]